jgi:hypothetical protein
MIRKLVSSTVRVEIARVEVQCNYRQADADRENRPKYGNIVGNRKSDLGKCSFGEYTDVISIVSLGELVGEGKSTMKSER